MPCCFQGVSILSLILLKVSKYVVDIQETQTLRMLIVKMWSREASDEFQGSLENILFL